MKDEETKYTPDTRTAEVVLFNETLVVIVTHPDQAGIEIYDVTMAQDANPLAKLITAAKDRPATVSRGVWTEEGGVFLSAAHDKIAAALRRSVTTLAGARVEREKAKAAPVAEPASVPEHGRKADENGLTRIDTPCFCGDPDCELAEQA